MLQTTTRSFRASVLGIGLMLVAACSKQGPVTLKDVNDHNLVQAADTSVSRLVGEGKSKFAVLGSDALTAGVNAGKILAVPSRAASEILNPLAHPLAQGTSDPSAPAAPAPAPSVDPSLTVGFPVELLDEYQVFGGVITGVSDLQSTKLGDLKLTDLPPLHVHPLVAKTAPDEYSFVLLGCANDCKEGSDELPLIFIPIVGVDQEKKQLLLNLASLGEKLNLIKMLDPKGEYTQLTTKSSSVTTVDYSLSTLVFDVAVKMVPVTPRLNLLHLLFPGFFDKAEPAPAPRAVADTAPETTFTVRWYLKLASAFTPSFEARDATDGVGFFMTKRATRSRIERRTKPTTIAGSAQDGQVHYFIKNVPKEYQASFAGAFDEWNQKFTKLMGGNIFSYEFVDAADPKAKLLVAGDPRFNIVEWDLNNSASYGGLGPSEANQFTGEIFSSNVLIQGPTIVTMYQQWFKTAQTVNQLRLAGRELEAEQAFHDGVVRLHGARSGNVASPQFSLRLGDGLDLQFRVPSQTPPLQDPLMARLDFEPIPTGYTYATYMDGYFHEMLAHELGHNLGLRHNFRGNLGAQLDPSTGGVSDSIMEYLGRAFREVNRVGQYDVMAISYGYLGQTPPRTDLYCTDEDVPSKTNLKLSAECSSDDATTDPFGYFDEQLTKAVDLLVARGNADAPTWTVDDMSSDLGTALKGMLLYAATADGSAAKWTAFFTGGDRPATPAGVKGYVLAKLRGHLCDASLAQVLTAKSNDDARAKVTKNLSDLQTAIAKAAADLGVYKDSDLLCQ